MTGARAGLFLCLSVLPSALRAEDPSTPAVLQEAVTDYREGRLHKALATMGRLAEREPENATVKSYIWAIVRKIQKDEDAFRLSAEEVEAAAREASESLAERRRRADEVLAQMKKIEQKSGDLRGPGELLSSMEGLERFISRDIEKEMADSQARVFLGTIVSNLSAALRRDVFVSRKDNFRAAGYLAYFQRDWERAAQQWRAALKEDPSDAAVRRDLSSLETLLAKKDAQARVQESANQARLYFRGGRYAQALEAWEEVEKIDPAFPGLGEQKALTKVALEKAVLQKTLKVMTEEGLAVYKAGDVLGGAQKWLEVLQLDPGFDEARSWLQHAGKRMKTAPPPAAAAGAAPLPAVRSERPSPAADPEKAMELYRDGMMLYSQERLSDAVEVWKQALRFDPSSVRAQEALRQAQKELSFP